jgi:hypothetical protein
MIHWFMNSSTLVILNMHAEYIYYLQDRISDLEREISSGYKDDEHDDNNNGSSS